MARLFYIHGIEPNSVLHFSPGNRSVLRDYSRSPVAKPIEHCPNQTAEQIEALAGTPPNFILNGQPKVSIDNIAFWHEHVRHVNEEYQIIARKSLLKRLKEHWIITSLAAFSGLIILIGSLTGAVDKIIDFWNRHFGGS